MNFWTEQAEKGDWDFKLLPIYYIAILDFPYDEHEEIRKFDRNVQLRDEDGFVFYDKLGFRFLQMPFFNKKETELVTHYDKWCYFLKHLQSFDDIPQILNEPVFDKAFKTAALAAMNPKDREEYEQSKLVYSELKAVMDTSKEEGREEGELNKARKIAKGMKVKGYTIDEIAELTNLTKEEIEKLWYLICKYTLPDQAPQCWMMETELVWTTLLRTSHTDWSRINIDLGIFVLCLYRDIYPLAHLYLVY